MYQFGGHSPKDKILGMVDRNFCHPCTAKPLYRISIWIPRKPQTAPRKI